MHAVPETTLETIAVKKGHKKLKILFFAVVGRGCH
jgi:hypothetical protein